MRPLLGHSRLGLARLYRRVGKPRQTLAEHTATVELFQFLGMAAALAAAASEAPLDAAPR